MSNAGRKHLNGLAAGKGDYANRHTVTLPDCFSEVVNYIGGDERNFAQSIRLIIYLYCDFYDENYHDEFLSSRLEALKTVIENDNPPISKPS